MSFITPTVGRIVLFRVGPDGRTYDERFRDIFTEFPAIVTRVWSDFCVNLTVFRDNDTPVAVTSVTHRDEDETPSWCGWRWAPYQKAVAAGTAEAASVPSGSQVSERETGVASTPSSLEVGDSEAAAVAVAPRVTLDGMNDLVAAEHYLNAEQAVSALGHPVNPDGPLSVLTLCVMVLTNGWTLVGKSACASPENFDQELGRKFAREDCIRQLWPLEGYALRVRLSQASQSPVP